MKTAALMKPPLLIGEVARRAGIGIGAIRLYERLGLIPAPARTRAGYRQYPEDTVVRVRVIHSAKSLGFTLREMGGLMAQLGPNGMSGVEKDALLDDKLREIEAKIRSLEHVRELLLHLRRAPARPSARAECALAKAAMNIVQALDRPERERRARTRRLSR